MNMNQIIKWHQERWNQCKNNHPLKWMSSICSMVLRGFSSGKIRSSQLLNVIEYVGFIGLSDIDVILDRRLAICRILPLGLLAEGLWPARF